MRCSTILLLGSLVVAGPTACDYHSPTTRSRGQPLGPSPRPAYHDLEEGLSFQVGDGVSVATEHHAVDDPGTIRSLYTLSGPEGLLLSVDVWRDPHRLPLETWFERHLAFTRDPEAVVRWTRLTTHQSPGMVIDRPRTPHAFPRRIAVVSVAGRVIRLTCHRSDDPAALALFERVLASLALDGGAR